MFSTQINGLIELTNDIATVIELRRNEDMIMRFNVTLVKIKHNTGGIS